MKLSAVFSFILVLIVTSCATPFPTVSVTPTSTVGEMPFPLKPTNGAAAGQSGLSQRTNLYSGPGNISYDTLAELPKDWPVTPTGVFGDFVRLDTTWNGVGITGFIRKNALGGLPDGIPELQAQDVPLEPFYLPRCAPGIFDSETNSVTFTTNPGERWFATESAPWSLMKPVQIRIEKLEGTDGGFAGIKLLGNPEGGVPHGDWYEGMTRMEITSLNGEYTLLLQDGSSENVQATIVLHGLSASDPIQIVFDQVEGKSLRVLDKNGIVKQKIDITTLERVNLPDGLFPRRVFYFGTHVESNKSMKVTGLSVGVEPDGRWIEGTVLNTYLDSSGLTSLAAGRQPTMGTTLEIDRTIDRRYCQILEREFKDVTISPNWGGEGGLWLGRGRYNFDPLDRIVNYALQRHWQVLMSHLVWGADQDIPDWLRNSNYPTEEYNNILHEHITAVMKHFAGRVEEWSIANEVFERSICSSGGVEEFWYNKLGYGYIDEAFRWAKEMDPKATLILNSAANYPPFNGCSQKVIDNMYFTVAGLNSSGNHLVDAVGMQMHLLFPYDTQTPPDKKEVVQTMKRFAQTGVKIYLTEFEVDIGSQQGTQAENRAFQAAVYRNMMDACLDSGVCANFTTWGFVDSLSWAVCRSADIPLCWNEPNGDPTMFDKNFLPKPAYFAMRGALAGTPWTGGTGIPAPQPEPRQAVIDCLSHLPAAPEGDSSLTRYDGFEASFANDAYDDRLWSPSVFSDRFFKSAILQQHGRLGMAASGDSSYGWVDLYPRQLGNFRLQDKNVFETQLGICPSSGTGDVRIGIYSNLGSPEEPKTWSAVCSINRYSSRYQARCSDWVFPDEEGRTFATEWQAIEAGRWYTVRIEIDPGTMTISYFIDGVMVGRHVPMDAYYLKSNDNFHFTVGLWKPGRASPIVGLADNVRIGKIGP
jgi:endo-1,4-beta-xylanase